MAVVLVTGTSSGFGAAIAEGFARRGDTVVATMRNPDAAKPELRRQLEEAGDVSFARLDVTNPESREHAISETVGQHGRLDVLVNNAGVTLQAPAEEVDLGEARAVFETNFWGPYELIRLAIPVMRAQEQGRIVNITSFAAIVGMLFESAYAAAKHALDSLSCSLDLELTGQGIRVSSVLPGAFGTGIVAKTADPSDLGGRYGNAIGQYRSVWAGMLNSNPDLGPVVDATVHAAVSDDPEPRYLVGVGMPTAQPAVDALNTVQAEFNAVFRRMLND